MKKIQTILFLNLTIVIAACNTVAQQTNITVEDFQKAVQNNNSQILDVRTIEEYNSGHIPKALQANWNNRKEFTDRTSHLQKNKPVYTYCVSGFRSAEATKWLKENGFKEVYNLSGGMVAWNGNNLPVEGKTDVPQISIQEFQSKLNSSETFLVDIGAVWCPPCKKMEPVIEKLSKENTSIFKLITIDGGEQTELANQLKVDAFPTFIIYKKGKEIWRQQGIVSYETLLNQLK